MESDLIRINKWLTPLSWLYGACTEARNLMFDLGILHSRGFPIPIINVGNITVGGTGKTPHVEYLVGMLSKRYKVAVLSRGYKRKSHGFLLATPSSTPAEIGDEPWQIMHKFPGIHVAVDSNRCRGIRNLMQNPRSNDVEVILLDDAFQHRHVRPGLNILLTDYHRLLTDDYLLPAGRLRESACGRYRADVIVVTKCPRNLSPMEYRMIQEELKPKPYQKLFFSSLTYSKQIQGVFTPRSLSFSSLRNTHVLLVTGIGCPQQMERDIRPHVCSMKTLPYPDHHNFSNEDITDIQAAIHSMPQPRIILTTEKDAVRLRAMDAAAGLLQEELYFLPIEIGFMRNATNTFNDKINRYVQENPRHRSMA